MCSKVISFEKSFASFEEIDKVKSWNYELNIGLIPENVFKHSNKKYYFDCYICKHTFHSILNGITSKNRGWCPYCSKPCKKLCNNNKCIFCFNNSFDSFDKEKVNCWNYEKNNSLPRDLFKATNTKYYFTCNKCDHEFKIALHHVTVNNKWCPYCAISCKKLCTNIDCDICFNKSFASFDSEKVNCWNYEKNKFNPRYVSKYSDKICWFICNNKHEFKKKLKHIAFDNRWCPHCKNKTEQKLLQHLQTKYSVIYQYRTKWCRHTVTNSYLPFDFVIHSLKLIIELDGKQHFQQVSNWQSPKEIQIRDKYKMKCANNNGYTVIRILQEDVFYDKNNWKISLHKAMHIYDKPTCIFISHNLQYASYFNE